MMIPATISNTTDGSRTRGEQAEQEGGGEGDRDDDQQAAEAGLFHAGTVHTEASTVTSSENPWLPV